MRLVVFQPDIAPNLGTMIRLGACLGVPVDVIEPCGFPVSAKTLRRAAMDYAAFADVTRHVSWEAYQRETAVEGRLVLLTTRAETAIWDHGFAPDDRLLVGQESAGVPEAVHAAADIRLTIPMPGGGRSLNVAISAAMALGEGVRQLRQGRAPGL